jgi:hypothetical protein
MGQSNISSNLKDRIARVMGERQQVILRAMLENPPQGKEWITMDRLSRVIAADKTETARLLFKIGARRSTGDRDVWALKSRKPLRTRS